MKCKLYTLTGHFIRYTLLVPPFAFRTALILRGIDSTRCWKHSSEMLVHVDMIASHSCCRFCRLHIHDANLPFHHIPKVLYWDLVSVEAIWGKWTNCHVQETSLKWFEFCDFVHYPAGSSIKRWVHCSHKGMEMVSNNTQVGCGV